MTTAENFEILGYSSAHAATASNLSVSDTYDENNNLTHHTFADGSTLELYTFTEVKTSEEME